MIVKTLAVIGGITLFLLAWLLIAYWKIDRDTWRYM